MVWPLGWVCHAVRAPGVKWTLLACTRDWSDGAATASMYTVPVNHSVGPAMVSMEFGVICMSFLLRGRCGTVSNLEYGREGRQDSSAALTGTAELHSPPWGWPTGSSSCSRAMFWTRSIL